MFVDGLVANKKNSRRIKRHSIELTERSKIVQAILAGGTDPADGPGDHETLEGIMGQTRLFTFGWLVEDNCSMITSMLGQGVGENAAINDPVDSGIVTLSTFFLQ